MSKEKRKFPCLTVVTKNEFSEEFPWILQDMGAGAVETRDSTTMTGQVDGRTLFVAGFDETSARDLAMEVLRTSHPHCEISAVDLTDDGWSSAWKDFFKPQVLDTLQIVTPWMERPTESRTTIVIDPGMAFGTGGHYTTKLILRLMERRFLSGGLPEDVLDVGTGSGVLAIAAVKLGAKRVLAIDIEEAAIDATLANARRNAVDESNLRVLLGGPKVVEGVWPLVLANIELSAFKQVAHTISQSVDLGGEVYLSGLLQEQIEECLSLWPDMVVQEIVTDNGWAAVSLRRSK